MITRRIINGEPLWFVVVEFFELENIATHEVRLATAERQLFRRVKTDENKQLP